MQYNLTVFYHPEPNILNIIISNLSYFRFYLEINNIHVLGYYRYFLCTSFFEKLQWHQFMRGSREGGLGVQTLSSTWKITPSPGAIIDPPVKRHKWRFAGGLMVARLEYWYGPLPPRQNMMTRAKKSKLLEPPPPRQNSLDLRPETGAFRSH